MSSDNGYATLADLFKHTERRHADVTVCGMAFKLQSLTAGEYAQVERKLIAAATDAKGTTEKRKASALAEGNALLLRYCVAEPDLSEADAAKLQDLDSRVSQKLVTACLEHCGLAGSDMEDLAKNSAETAGDGRPIG